MNKKLKKLRCGDKIRHKSQYDAVKHLIAFNNKQYSTYLCPYCRGWHIGKSNSELKIQARLDQLLNE